jgi:guanosine-3',5'-bis(diphosphate) 3'-pyrophosphohydrolase
VSNLEPERQTEVEWGALQDGDSERRTTVRVVCKDEPGLLSQMTNTISSKGVNITQAHCRTREDGLATNIFEVSVSHASQLNDATRALNKLEGVVSVERVKG